MANKKSLNILSKNEWEDSPSPITKDQDMQRKTAVASFELTTENNSNVGNCIDFNISLSQLQSKMIPNLDDDTPEFKYIVDLSAFITDTNCFVPDYEENDYVNLFNNELEPHLNDISSTIIDEYSNEDKYFDDHLTLLLMKYNLGHIYANKRYEVQSSSRRLLNGCFENIHRSDYNGSDNAEEEENSISVLSKGPLLFASSKNATTSLADLTIHNDQKDMKTSADINEQIVDISSDSDEEMVDISNPTDEACNTVLITSDCNDYYSTKSLEKQKVSSKSMKQSGSFEAAKRIHHKNIERNRRERTKVLLEAVKKQIPSIKDKNRVSKLAIIKEATKFCDQLKEDFKLLSVESEFLKTEIHNRQRLLNRLKRVLGK